LLGIAVRCLAASRARLILATLALAVLFFLAASQVGLLVGWCNTNSALIRHAKADVWVMARQTPAFDYGGAIPRHRIYQVRSVTGVEWAEGLFMAWNTWKRPDGQSVNVELVGLDESNVAGPWDLVKGNIDSVHLPDSVIVDELFLPLLGVREIGDEFEMYARRARIGGISRSIRTFTASPFIFTSINSARKYDRRYRDDEITYVMARAWPGVSPETLAQRIRTEIPDAQVMTSSEFAIHTMRYWMLGTGVGITVVLTAVLGLGVSVVISSQTLFTVTQEHLPTYAMLAALGFGRAQLVGWVLIQTAILAGSGVVLGSGLFYAGCVASARTPIPLETTPSIFAGIVCLSLLSSLAASYLSVKAVLSVDPVSVFRA
jgi:putative ABC transport system permease protein